MNMHPHIFHVMFSAWTLPLSHGPLSPPLLHRVLSRKMAEFGEERTNYIKLGAEVFSEFEVTIKILVGVAIMKHRTK